jgi:fucose permease
VGQDRNWEEVTAAIRTGTKLTDPDQRLLAQQRIDGLHRYPVKTIVIATIVGCLILPWIFGYMLRDQIFDVAFVLGLSLLSFVFVEAPLVGYIFWLRDRSRRCLR